MAIIHTPQQTGSVLPALVAILRATLHAPVAFVRLYGEALRMREEAMKKYPHLRD